jgi:hypothetical protein
VAQRRNGNTNRITLKASQPTHDTKSEVKRELSPHFPKGNYLQMEESSGKEKLEFVEKNNDCMGMDLSSASTCSKTPPAEDDDL